MSEPAVSGAVDTVRECLNKNIAELSWLEPLKMHAQNQVPEQWAAIGFDTNALKKMRRVDRNTRSSILTYLQSKSVPIIIPAQAIQEFWNNHGIFVKDVKNLEGDTKKLAAKYEKLQGGPATRRALETMAAQVASLAEDLEDSRNPQLLSESIELWELLLPESSLAQVPRGDFFPIGEHRFVSGIGPGTADENKKANRLGDFYIWADFLVGLLNLGMQREQQPDSTIVFVTEDGKEDWVSSGVPHPTLLGEVFELTGRPLLLLTMDELAKYVQS